VAEPPSYAFPGRAGRAWERAYTLFCKVSAYALEGGLDGIAVRLR